MFPLQPTGFFITPSASVKPNANSISNSTTGTTGGPFSFNNLPNAYDSDPSTFAEISGSEVGLQATFSGNSFQQIASFSHSPSSGGTTSSNIQCNILMDATLSVSAITGNVQLQYFAKTANSSIIPNFRSLINLDPVAAANFIAANGTPYVISLAKQNIGITLSPVTAFDLFAQSLSLTLQASQIDPSNIISFTFDSKIYDITYFYV